MRSASARVNAPLPAPRSAHVPPSPRLTPPARSARCIRPASSKIRRAATFAARRSPSSGRSFNPTPRSTTTPDLISATRSSPTSTLAERTRCTIARVSRGPPAVASFQHPRIVAADDRLDLRRGKMPRREDRHVLTQRKARDESHLAEAIAVLEQEGRPVDLEPLPMGGRRRRHARSMPLEVRPGILRKAYARQSPGILGEARVWGVDNDARRGVAGHVCGLDLIGTGDGSEQSEAQNRHDERCHHARAERSPLALPTLSAPTAASIVPAV